MPVMCMYCLHVRPCKLCVPVFVTHCTELLVLGPFLIDQLRFRMKNTDVVTFIVAAEVMKLQKKQSSFVVTCDHLKQSNN